MRENGYLHPLLCKMWAIKIPACLREKQTLAARCAPGPALAQAEPGLPQALEENVQRLAHLPYASF